MASKSSTSLAVFLVLNILLFTLTKAQIARLPPLPFPRTPIPIPTPPGGMSPTPAPVVSTCPRNALQLGACARVLGVNLISLGRLPMEPCCSLLDGLVDLEVGFCLCTVLRLLGSNFPIALSLIVNDCGRGLPIGFRCP